MGLLSGLGKVDWGSVANGLGAAQSFFDGDFATGSGLLAYGAKQRSAAQKARDEEEERRRLLDNLVKQGLTPEQAEIVANNAGNIGDFREEPEKPIAAQRNVEWWQNATPEDRDAFRQFEEARNPFGGMVRGADGRMYPLPGGATTPYNPNDWEPITDEEAERLRKGGGVGNGVGTFRGPYGF